MKSKILLNDYIQARKEMSNYDVDSTGRIGWQALVYVTGTMGQYT
jgi:hypothetical protein